MNSNTCQWMERFKETCVCLHQPTSKSFQVQQVYVQVCVLQTGPEVGGYRHMPVRLRPPTHWYNMGLFFQGEHFEMDTNVTSIPF